MIHADPVDLEDPVLERYKTLIASYMYEKGLTAHDIHLEDGILKLDIMLEDDETDREQITAEVTEAVHKISPDIPVQIDFDFNFTEKEES